MFILLEIFFVTTLFVILFWRSSLYYCLSTELLFFTSLFITSRKELWCIKQTFRVFFCLFFKCWFEETSYNPLGHVMSGVSRAIRTQPVTGAVNACSVTLALYGFAYIKIYQGHWLFQHHAPLNSQSCKGWSDSGLCPSSIDPRSTPPDPEPSKGSLCSLHGQLDGLQSVNLAQWPASKASNLNSTGLLLLHSSLSFSRNTPELQISSLILYI